MRYIKGKNLRITVSFIIWIFIRTQRGIIQIPKCFFLHLLKILIDNFSIKPPLPILDKFQAYRCHLSSIRSLIRPPEEFIIDIWCLFPITNLRNCIVCVSFYWIFTDLWSFCGTFLQCWLAPGWYFRKVHHHTTLQGFLQMKTWEEIWKYLSYLIQTTLIICISLRWATAVVWRRNLIKMNKLLKVRVVVWTVREVGILNKR